MASRSDHRPLRPEDLYGLRAVSDVALHPHDSTVVYAVWWPDQATDTNRWQLHAHRGEEVARQISYGHADRRPRFNPSGQQLAFTRTTPDQPTRLMVLDWTTRAEVEVATFPDGIHQLCWVDDQRLAVLTPRRPADQEGLDDDELARRPRIITQANYRANGRGWTHDRRRQVALVDLTSGDPTATVTDLTGTDPEAAPGSDHLALAIDPEARWLATIATPGTSGDIAATNDIWLQPLDRSAPPHRLTTPGGAWRHLVWHPGGSLVATGSEDASAYSFTRPYRIDPEAGTVTVLGPHDANATPIMCPDAMPVPVPDGILVIEAEAGTMAIHRYDLHHGGRTRLETNPDHSKVLAVAASADGKRIVGAVTTPDRPAELWELGPSGPNRLVALNDDLLDQIELGATEVVDILHPDGHSVPAFIVWPPSAAPGTGPRPGLVMIHGGPMSHYGYGFNDEFQMAAAEGYVVIGPNPRGSDGYGEDWALALVGRLGTVDWDDVQATTDHLAGREGVDADRIGIGGGSYGGFMASWAIGHTDRYQAALVERAVTSWVSLAGTSDIGPQFVPQLAGASPETDRELLHRQSPLTYASAVTTPTLIVHSEADWRCPPEQAEQFFAALRRQGVEVTMVRFPGEDHELSRSGSPRHRVERFEIIHQFFNRHLQPEH